MPAGIASQGHPYTCDIRHLQTVWLCLQSCRQTCSKSFTCSKWKLFHVVVLAQTNHWETFLGKPKRVLRVAKSIAYGRDSCTFLPMTQGKHKWNLSARLCWWGWLLLSNKQLVRENWKLEVGKWSSIALEDWRTLHVEVGCNLEGCCRMGKLSIPPPPPRHAQGSTCLTGTLDTTQ